MVELQYPRIWQKVLAPDEKVIHEFSIGDQFRLFSFILILIPVMLFMFWMPWVGLVLLLVAAFICGFYLKVANAFALTDQRIIIHTGWLNTQTVSVDYSKITDITVKDNIFERLLAGTGNLAINTAGGPEKEILLLHIDSPYEVRKQLVALRAGSGD